MTFPSVGPLLDIRTPKSAGAFCSMRACARTSASLTEGLGRFGAIGPTYWTKPRPRQTQQNAVVQKPVLWLCS